MAAHPLRHLAIVAVLALLVPRLAAQEMAAPVEVQVPLLMKVLAFDHALAERVGDELVVGVAFQSRYRPSLEAKEVVLRAGAGASVKALPTRFVTFEVDATEALPALLSRYEVDVLYLAPLRALSVRELARRAHEEGVLTLTGVPAYVDEGVGVGIGLRGGRPEILVHQHAARAAGARLSAQLLKLARLIDPV